MTAFEPLLMRRSLSESEPAPAWPPGVSARPARPGDEVAIHALLVSAFAGNREEIPAFAEWQDATLTDDEFAWDCWCLAEVDGRLVGAALCWTSAFVKDLAVDPGFRGRGLGEALLRHTFVLFAARGEREIALKVDPENPTGAVRLYLRLGFQAA